MYFLTPCASIVRCVGEGKISSDGEGVVGSAEHFLTSVSQGSPVNAPM